MIPLTHAEARAAFSSVVDADLAGKRARLALRMAQARQSLAEGHREASERNAAFWRDYEASRALDAEWTREQAKAGAPARGGKGDSAWFRLAKSR